MATAMATEVSTEMATEMRPCASHPSRYRVAKQCYELFAVFKYPIGVTGFTPFWDRATLGGTLYQVEWSFLTLRSFPII